MRSYRVFSGVRIDGERQVFFFFKDRAAAHEHAKNYPEPCWPQVLIHLVELPTDADAVHDYLNGRQPVSLNVSILRTWCLTQRGGLHELQAGEAPPAALEGLVERSAHTETINFILAGTPEAAAAAQAFWDRLNTEQKK